MNQMGVVPFTQGIEYRSTGMWPHPEQLPKTVHSLLDCRDSIVRIPQKVTNSWNRQVPVISVSRKAFHGNETVTDILLPRTISAIAEGAFAGCKNLQRITIPKAVRSIWEGTFEGCSSLEDVYYEGSPEEWEQVYIVHERHEIEFGPLIPGTPVDEVAAERRIHIPGNDALLMANIHFYCGLG
jgi:hypothetical protein